MAIIIKTGEQIETPCSLCGEMTLYEPCDDCVDNMDSLTKHNRHKDTVFSKLKRKHSLLARFRNKHDDYFMTDEEYEWQQYCEANKEELDRFVNAMIELHNAATITAKEVMDSICKTFGYSEDE
jgi:hypoxanthine phosphoribosyltransferase